MPNKAKKYQPVDNIVVSEVEKLVDQIDRSDLAAYVTYLHTPWRIWMNNLLAGIAHGLGFVLGATVFVSLTVFISVQVLGRLPWVGDTFGWINDNINISEIKNFTNSLSSIDQNIEKLNELTTEQNNLIRNP